MKDYSNVKRSDMKTELETMKTVTKSDILNLLCINSVQEKVRNSTKMN